MLDVGQGQAVLLRDPSGAAVLVDTGPDGDPPAVLAGLARAGVDRLAALVVSHGQADHAGAVEALLATLPVGVVVHGPPGPDDPGLGTVRRTAAAAGVPSRAVVAGDELVVGGWRLDVRWPRPGPWRGDPNARSVVLHATTRGLGALVPGDAESPILLPLGLPRADVLAVPHHGSADPGLPALLRRVAPTVALVSSGEGNRFGHPAPQTLRALREAGVPVRRTDGDGDLRVMAGG
jgi:competence protein ComEC